jgi:ubiquinone/menaquinone biosynthesis C-methylase UbiE
MPLIEFTCPLCHHPLRHETDAYVCERDQKRFPVTFGIPDFRIFHEELVKPSFEGSLVAGLVKEYPQRSFKEFIEFDQSLDPAMPSRLLRRRRAHILGGYLRAKNSLAEIHRLGGLSEKGRFLELGCGTGGFLVAAADMFESAIGLDLSLPRLIIAKKQLEETGRQAVLIAANAEFLPFPDESFHLVVGSDVIEHVENSFGALQESYRVLKSHGTIFLATPNRWSLTPEPHVNVWGVGWLPNAWREPYVQLVRKLPYRHIHLLNWFELRQLLRQTQFRQWQIVLPSFSSEQAAQLPNWARRVVPLYHTVTGFPLTRWLACLFGPLFHVVCMKK